jgi:hypothetical protein
VILRRLWTTGLSSRWMGSVPAQRRALELHGTPTCLSVGRCVTFADVVAAGRSGGTQVNALMKTSLRSTWMSAVPSCSKLFYAVGRSLNVKVADCTPVRASWPAGCRGPAYMRLCERRRFVSPAGVGSSIVKKLRCLLALSIKGQILDGG